jgi:hypothetical protein
MITTGGVPLLWPIVIKPPKFLRRLPLLKDVWKANGAFSIPLLGRAGSRREWFVLIPVSGYAMVGMAVAVLSLAKAHFPAAVALGTALADSLFRLPPG